MNSKQSARYIKSRMGNDFEAKKSHSEWHYPKAAGRWKTLCTNCPRCSLVNAIENKYCPKCSYPLVPSAFDEIKEAENRKTHKLKQSYDGNMNQHVKR